MRTINNMKTNEINKNEEALAKAAREYQKNIESNNPQAEAWDFYGAFIAGATWRDKRMQHVIACATANLIATLTHCKIFSDESIAQCAEDFKNDLIKEAKLC